MSTATLNVWISNLGQPCSIANDEGAGIPYHWSVAVAHCDGQVLNWSEGRYRLHHEDKWLPIPKHTPQGITTAGWWYEMIPTRDGHVEIEVPPGCYTVVASMHTWFEHGVLYGNWATDRAIVQGCCGDDVCVRLYASSFQPCHVILFKHVLPMLMRNNKINEKDGQAAINALTALHNPEQLSPFEKGYLALLDRQFNQMGKPSALEDPDRK
jgi:hypothetical protein